MYQQPVAGQANNWLTSGLFNCCDDCTTCCITCWLPCITYAENGQLLDAQDPNQYWIDCLVYTAVAVFTGCQCILGMGRRERLRYKYQLPAVPCNDCCVHCCCHGCALCQESRELRARKATGMPAAYPYQAGPQPGVPVQTSIPPQYTTEPPKIATL